jgi:ubiquinone/menaquinone biosynthesis C-methylase UbiE
MKDIVENRRRISFAHKLRLARLAIKENGVAWCALLFVYYLSSMAANRAFASMDRLRKTRNVPGLNSPSLNKAIWDSWNWSTAGEEWSVSPTWKQSLTRCVLQKYVPSDSSILEIGPGGGRWTEALLDRARKYSGVDISSACVAHCRSRFAHEPHANFFVGSGSNLAMIATNSIDAIWSFDVFVHINRTEIEGYAKEFLRVLRPGGVAVIHHGTVAGASGGWRSNLTMKDISQIFKKYDLCIARSFSEWTDESETHALAYNDQITVLRAPSPPQVSA